MKKILLAVIIFTVLALTVPFLIEAQGQTPMKDPPKFLEELPGEIRCILDFIQNCVVPPIAGFAIVVAGIIFMFSGASPQIHNQAKDALIYIVVGLLIIWGAIELVEAIIGSGGIPACPKERGCF